MVGSFINPVVNPDAKLGMSSFDQTPPVILLPNSSQSECEVVIRAIYRQVLGNAHVMESERLVTLESQLQQREISVRNFVYLVACSELYRSQFYNNCARMRSIELNFKHLLGRAPESYAEIVEHGQYLDQHGFEADIAAYVDSHEYLDAFGENIVPYYRGHKTQSGHNLVGFTHMLTLLRGAASSDKNLVAGNRARLNVSLISNHPSPIRAVEGANLTAAVSNVEAILAELFKPKFPVETTLPPIAIPAPAIAVVLQQEVRDQSQMIATLQQQLADLSPFASIGTHLSDWQSGDASGSAPSHQDTPTERIAKLQAQIADARRYAAIGESRINKWRGRVFNG